MKKYVSSNFVTKIVIISLIIVNQPIGAYADVRAEQAIDAEQAFYNGHYKEAEHIFDVLTQKKDRDFALWNNQLGSVYLAEGEYDKAEDSFLKAHYLMNDVEAFKELEAGAISLFGSEAQKAYKGDPYEKLFNSLYVALLLDRSNDLDNSLAAIKNGILCDSDVKADLYQSDSAALYLLASRITLLQGDKEKSKDYYEKALNAYRMTYPTNVPIVFTEQAQIYLLKERQEELDKLNEPEKKSKKTQQKIDDLKTEIGKIEGNIKTLQQKREKNNKDIDISMLQKFTDLNNNTLLCIELGKGPIKYQLGQYGQYALFTEKPHNIEQLKVLIDGKEIGSDIMVLKHDTLFQAITRGGRKMDSILKGQAQFKQTTADMAMIGMRTSQDMINSINRQASVNPYGNYSGAYMAAGVIALVSIGVAIASAAANPTADIRHWSLMPNDVIILPCYLSPGKHKIEIKGFDKINTPISDCTSSVDIDPNKKADNIIFSRLF